VIAPANFIVKSEIRLDLDINSHQRENVAKACC